MKTNLEWYKLLPEPYRMQAINNAERDDVLGMKISSLPASLFAFHWETTPEGMLTDKGYLKKPKQESSINRSRLPVITS